MSMWGTVLNFLRARTLEKMKGGERDEMSVRKGKS